MSTDRQRSPSGAAAWPKLVFCFLLVLSTILPLRLARAQDDLDDVLGNLGTAKAVGDVPEGQKEGEGSIQGRVFDGEQGTPVRGVTVIVVWPQEGPGEPHQEIAITDGAGFYELPSIPPGRYDLSFVKAGYRTSAMKNFEVRAGVVNPADFPLPPVPTGTSDQVLQLDEYVVEASTVGEMMDALDIRMESDQMLNIMSAEDLSKYASGDVADALKRVAGVNVVEGQFAIIRGLEDRYSSTLYNGAPVPSPDPDRQSVPLDLFPSEIVNNLVVTKTFAPELPSNSAGGSIDIVTHQYPEEPFSFTVSAKGGINENAWDRFLKYQGGSPVGKEVDGTDTIYGEVSAALGGRKDFWKREVRYKAVVNWQSDYDTAKGFQEGRQPARFGASSHFPAGDLAFGELSLTKGRFDLTTSAYDERLTLFGGFGFDLDEAGNHKIDASVFWTRAHEKTVQLREDGYLPSFDYGILPQLEADGEEIDFNVFDGSSPPYVPGQVATENSWIARSIRVSLAETVTRGAPWASSFQEDQSFKVRRDLFITQVNGEHEIARVDGLKLTWAANYATTSQDDEALGARIWFEPCGLTTLTALGCPAGVTPINQIPGGLPTVFPVDPADLGPGKYLAAKGLLSSSNSIDEDQYFGRADGEYERDLLDWLAGKVTTGIWYEHAKRNVTSDFLKAESTTIAGCTVAEGCVGSGTQFAIFADTPEELGRKIFGTALNRGADGSLSGLITTKNESKREIAAWNLGVKATLWEWLDLLGGVRLENILIESKNDPFTPGFAFDQTPLIFPTKYLFLDRLDNSVREFKRPPPYNDEILGLDPSVGPCRDTAGNVIPAGQYGSGQCVDLIDSSEIQGAVNGKIDENRALPSAGIAFRPFDWLTLRGAYSQTVARPSFREIGYYVSVEPGTDDLTIGNPRLGLSDVESFDGRLEVVWGDVGDLFAFSGFYKTIQDPIEQIVVRDPTDFDGSSTSQFRTFFNNPSEAKLWGIEVEGRKNLGFLSFGAKGLGFLDYLSLGGNFTWIDAQVDRSDAELERSTAFFGRTDLVSGARFDGLKQSRRLYGQPEWIVNADVTFDQPDWGTRATLAFFGISDVLDAAGVATPNQAGQITSFTLDQYVGSYGQLDLIVSQRLWKGLSIKLTAKNLTDSKRSILYDPEQTTQKIKERQYKVGRDYTVELKYAF